MQGSHTTGAEFNVGVSLLTFTYFLKLKFDPAYFTMTWTLDYQYSSDFGKYSENMNNINVVRIFMELLCRR